MSNINVTLNMIKHFVTAGQLNMWWT